MRGWFADITGIELMHKLWKAGFVFDRWAKGSDVLLVTDHEDVEYAFRRHPKWHHEIWWNPRTRRRTTVLCHPGKLPEATVRAIVSQAGLTVEELRKL